VTVISDGEAVLPNLVRAATREPVRHILDWFHLSMRIRPIEQMLLSLSGRDLRDIGPLQAAQASIERVGRFLWHGRPAQADQELVRFACHSENLACSGAEPEQVVTRDLLRHCSELRGCVHNNHTGIAIYHRRYHSNRPVSTSRAEGCIDEIANARMGKRQRMRWSPHRAHRVAVVRATVLDGRLRATSYGRMAN
jgi:hypothetical protein